MQKSKPKKRQYRRKGKINLHEPDEPSFLMHESDPKYKPPKPEKSNKGKYKKVLTNTKRGSIIKGVHKLIGKDDKKMNAKPKNQKQFDWRGAVKSLAWLVEAAFRGFIGWILLSNFDNLATTAVAFYALGTAGIIVVMHFVRANRK